MNKKESEIGVRFLQANLDTKFPEQRNSARGKILFLKI